MEELAPVIQELVHACWQNRRAGRAGLAAGLVVMLVGKGLADGERVRTSACNSVSLQLVGVLRRERRSGAAVATGRDSRIGGARGLLRRVGLLRLNPLGAAESVRRGAAEAKRR